MNTGQKIVLGFGLTFAVYALSAWVRGKNLIEQGGDIVSGIAKYTQRGLRNNNAGNIRISANAWQGKIPVDHNTDGTFEQFETPEYGIRALSHLLRNYASKYGATSVADFVNKYAPPSENDTGSYVDAVASDMGVDANSNVNLADNNVMVKMVAAIVRHENGIQPYDVATIASGVEMS